MVDVFNRDDLFIYLNNHLYIGKEIQKEKKLKYKITTHFMLLECIGYDTYGFHRRNDYDENINEHTIFGHIVNDVAYIDDDDYPAELYSLLKKYFREVKKNGK